jgi:hypothetical protein
MVCVSLVSVDVSAFSTLAVFVCVSTDADAIDWWYGQSAEAADTDRPNAAAIARKVLIVFSSLVDDEA